MYDVFKTIAGALVVAIVVVPVLSVVVIALSNDIKALTEPGKNPAMAELGKFLAAVVGIVLVIVLVVLFGNDHSGTSVAGRTVVKGKVALEKAVEPYEVYADSLRKSKYEPEYMKEY